MIEAIVGSRSSEQVLIFLAARDRGYATEIADFFSAELYAIQKQLKRLEEADVLVSRKVGRTRVYEFNPRYAFLQELQRFLLKVLEFYPTNTREGLLMNRRRPRRSGKPI